MDGERADSLISAHGNGERDVDNENINKFSLIVGWVNRMLIKKWNGY